MNANISGFVICAEAITYLLLQNLHGCTFNTSVFLPRMLMLQQLQVCYRIKQWNNALITLLKE